MIANRKTRWVFALVGVLVCALIWGLFVTRRAGAQMNDPRAYAPAPVPVATVSPDVFDRPEVAEWMAEHPQRPAVKGLSVDSPDADGEFVVTSTTCIDILYTWDNVPSYFTPLSSPNGSVLVSCANGTDFSQSVWKELTIPPTFYYHTGIPWAYNVYGVGICNIFAAVPYNSTIPPGGTVYWRHLDWNPIWQCSAFKLPLVVRGMTTGQSDVDCSKVPCAPYPAPTP